MNEFYATFGSKYAYEPHPAMGMVPSLPDQWVTVLADDIGEARELLVSVIGLAWSNIRPDIDKSLFRRGEYGWITVAGWRLGEVARLDDYTYRVRSLTRPNHQHTVQFIGDNTLCTCPHGLNNGGRAHCRHVEEARRWR